MNPVIEKLEKAQELEGRPEVEIGSTVKVTTRIEEEGKERLQSFTGIVIAKRGSSIRKTITLRRTVGNYSVERIFFLHSPQVASIETLKKGKVRRAKLYYLRDKIGKSAKIAEKV